MSDSARPANGLLIGMGDRVADLGKSGPLGLLIGIIGLAVMAALYFTQDKTIAVGSWMFAWYAWMTVTMGMFTMIILTHTIRPRWGVGLLRLFEAAAGPVGIAVMAVLFIPVIANTGSIYLWAMPDQVAHDPVIQYKARYLNFNFWLIRTVFYFAVWIAYSWYMRNSVRRQERMIDDPVGGKRLEMGRSSWGAFGLLMLAMTYTFGITDWVMSLEPRWYSTMHALWQMVASALGGLALAVAIACVNARREPYPEIIAPKLTRDWGNMLFTVTMLWAYTALSQYLIMWNGNLPDTAQYYARRGFLMWNIVGMVTLVGQWFVPWMTLLSPRVKRYPHLLAQVAGWIFVIHIVDTYNAVVPGLPAATEVVGNVQRVTGTRAAGENLLFDLIALVTIGGFWLYSFSVQVRKAPLLVNYDHRLQEDKAHGH